MMLSMRISLLNFIATVRLHCHIKIMFSMKRVHNLAYGKLQLLYLETILTATKLISFLQILFEN